MKQYILIGNYGVGNFGDEAMLKYFTTRFTDVRWSVLSASPTAEQLPRLPFGIRSFFTAKWFKTIRVYMQSNGVVFGGGTLFTDIESVKACFIWGLHAFLAFVLRKEIHLAYQGIGPFTTKTGYNITRFVCSHATSITVRDTASFRRIQQMGIEVVPKQTFDPVLTLVPTEFHYKQSTSTTLVLIPRHNSGAEFISLVKKHVHKKTYDKILIALFQPEDSKELLYCARLKKEFNTTSVINVVTMQDVISAITPASFVISQRFHGTILAKALNVPVQSVYQSLNDKHTQLERDMRNIPSCIALVKATEQELKGYLR